MTQNYKSLRRELSELPMTLYPDLIRATIEADLKKVFLKGAQPGLCATWRRKYGTN